MDEEIQDRENHMYVCRHCLCAIECHEGRQATLEITVDKDDDESSRCDWCGENGFDTLFKLI